MQRLTVAFRCVVLLLATTTPVVIGAQATAPVFVFPVTHPEVDFEGTWTNVSELQGAIARLQITKRGDSWFAHLWGACASCDWGEQPLRRVSDPTSADRRLRLAGTVWTRGLSAGRPGMTNVKLARDGPQLAVTYLSYATSSSAPASVTEHFRPVESAPPDARAVQGSPPGLEPGRMVAPQPIKRATPGYTSPAMRAGVAGIVLVQGVVETDGTLSDVHVVRSLDQQFGLDEEALKAARQWRFEPGTKDGEPVRAEVTIELEFRLRTGPPELTWP
jgi:TonB family protein